MSKTDSSHYRLCLKGAEWLRRQEFGATRSLQSNWFGLKISK